MEKEYDIGQKEPHFLVTETLLKKLPSCVKINYFEMEVTEDEYQQLQQLFGKAHRQKLIKLAEKYKSIQLIDIEE